MSWAFNKKGIWVEVFAEKLPADKVAELKAEGKWSETKPADGAQPAAKVEEPEKKFVPKNDGFRYEDKTPEEIAATQKKVDDYLKVADKLTPEEIAKRIKAIIGEEPNFLKKENLCTAKQCKDCANFTYYDSKWYDICLCQNKFQTWPDKVCSEWKRDEKKKRFDDLTKNTFL